MKALNQQAADVQIKAGALLQLPDGGQLRTVPEIQFNENEAQNSLFFRNPA